MKESLDVIDSIRTFSGIYINVFKPEADMIAIIDVAHALSCQPRFGGHLPKPYSVAQHSVMCAKLAKEEDKLQALLHDASEAYLLDMPSPIKRRLSQYKTVEKRLMKVIAKKYGFQFPLNEAVHAIDRQALEFEWGHMVLKNPLPEDMKFEVWNQKRAKNEFLKMFNKLI